MQEKTHLYIYIHINRSIYAQINMKIGALRCTYNFQHVYSIRYMYLWLYIAIYTQIYSIYTPERCVQYIHSLFAPRKLIERLN